MQTVYINLPLQSVHSLLANASQCKAVVCVCVFLIMGEHVATSEPRIDNSYSEVSRYTSYNVHTKASHLYEKP